MASVVRYRGVAQWRPATCAVVLTPWIQAFHQRHDVGSWHQAVASSTAQPTVVHDSNRSGAQPRASYSRREPEKTALHRNSMRQDGSRSTSLEPRWLLASWNASGRLGCLQPLAGGRPPFGNRLERGAARACASCFRYPKTSAHRASTWVWPCCQPMPSGARSPRRRHPSAHRPRSRGADAHSEGQARARSHPQPPADSRRHYAVVCVPTSRRLARMARMARTRPCPKRARWHPCWFRWASGRAPPSIVACCPRPRSLTWSSPGCSGLPPYSALAFGDYSPLLVHRSWMKLHGPSRLQCAGTSSVRRPPHPISCGLARGFPGCARPPTQHAPSFGAGSTRGKAARGSGSLRTRAEYDRRGRAHARPGSAGA